MPDQETVLGTRIATRRQHLGLTREAVAELVGSTPGYLRYVEEGQALPSAGFMVRLAHSLETTVGALADGGPDGPSPADGDARAPRLKSLNHEECRALLPTYGIGRLAVRARSGPAIIPLNYVVADGTVAYRTARGSVAASAAEHEVVFEVDQVDEVSRQGWSINVVGVARAVTGDAAARGLDQLAPALPWAGGDRRLWLSIVPTRMTGRRIEFESASD
ncbi:helix-turn-helix domain-containing protein [Streptomyces sp. NPDC087658]|uniref:helix-turn-helix domain-containing protein n=1 Tax=Streptomyces sp. NPDC087658 TaxID=3365800 RepID=UPI0038271150